MCVCEGDLLFFLYVAGESYNFLMHGWLHALELGDTTKNVWAITPHTFFVVHFPIFVLGNTIYFFNKFFSVIIYPTQLIYKHPMFTVFSHIYNMASR